MLSKNLNPKKQNILDPRKEKFVVMPTISEILQQLNITPEDYYNALSISSDNDFQIHSKHQPNECFINNYFVEGFQAWGANIDIQPVFNHYKAVTYMCAYFSKTENETSEAMKQAAEKSGMSERQKMRAVAKAYSKKRECSVQEVLYLLMPELWLRKTFPKVIFLDSKVSEECYRMFHRKEDLEGVPGDSTDIFQRNMLDRYLDKPDATFKSGKFAYLDSICYAEFLSCKSKEEAENDNQAVVLDDELMNLQHSANHQNETI